MKQILTLNNNFIGIKASQFLKDMHLAKSKIYKILNNKDFVFSKDDLKIDLSSLEFITYKPYKYDLKIVYEDDYFLIISKPKGYRIYDIDNKSVCNMVSYYYQKNNMKHPVLYAHRLDIETSGILVFAKDHVTLSYLNYNFKKFSRIYIALVVGNIKGIGVINRNISRDRHNNKMISLNKTGKDSTTFYQVLDKNKDKSLVAFKLLSGRKHQIRVHLSTINAHIYGDNLYSNINYDSNMMLHSYKFKFYHPYLKKEITLYDDYCNDLKILLERFNLSYGACSKINF